MDRRSMLRAGLSVAAAATAGCGGIGDHFVGRTPTTAPETDRQVNRLGIYGALGYPAGTGTLEEIGGVALEVGLCCGSEPVDLTEVRVQWVSARGSFDIVHESVYDGEVDSAFALRPVVETPTAQFSPVLESKSDRVALVVDLGRSESAAGADNYIAEAYETALPDEAVIREKGLESGETATVRLVTPSGAITVTQLRVPEFCSCRAPIQL